MTVIFAMTFVLGAVFFIISLFYLKSEAPVASLNPRLWFISPKKERALYRGPGYHFIKVGRIWMGIGLLGMIAGWLF